jgi:hypothetical protein
MTMTASSPATENRATKHASGESPKTYGTTLPIPRTEAEASELLARVDSVLRGDRTPATLVLELTRFLGANSAAWSPQNRARLRRTLAGLDAATVIGAIVTTVQAHPRTDVLDEAELVLRALPPHAFDPLQRLVGDRSLEPAVRACVLRAAARSADVDSASLLYETLNDPDSEVREVAAGLVADLEVPGGRIRLERRLEREANAMVQEALRDALASLPQP